MKSVIPKEAKSPNNHIFNGPVYNPCTFLIYVYGQPRVFALILTRVLYIATPLSRN